MRWTPVMVGFALSLMPLSASGQNVVTFDGYRTSSGGYVLPSTHLPLYDGYGGLNWRGFRVLPPAYCVPCEVDYTWYINDPGIQTHPDWDWSEFGVAAGQEGAQFYASGPFNLRRAHLAARFLNGVSLNVWGFRRGVATHFRSFTINVDAPALLDFDFYKVDRVVFQTVGGCASSDFFHFHEYDPSYQTSLPALGYCRPPGDDTYAGFAIDNVAVSEPSSLLLLSSGLIGILLFARRRRPSEDEA